MARPATNLRHRVLAAARDAFDRHGFDGAALRAIARGARTTIGMIYYYFPTKDALWDAVIDETYRRVLAHLAEVLAAPGSLRDQLRQIARHITALTDDDRRVIRLTLRDALSPSPRRQRLFKRFQRGHIPLVLGAVERARASGEVDDAVPLSMVGFMAAVSAVLSSLVLGSLPLPGLPVGDQRIDVALELLYRGIARPA